MLKKAKYLRIALLAGLVLAGCSSPLEPAPTVVWDPPVSPYCTVDERVTPVAIVCYAPDPKPSPTFGPFAPALTFRR